MGWTVHYRLVTPAPLTDADRAMLAAVANKWNPKLHDGCEQIWFEHLADASKAANIFGTYDLSTMEFVPAELDASKSYVWGFTKVHYSEAPVKDLCTVVRALQEVAAARSDWTLVVTDDYDSFDEDIRSVDPDALERELADDA